MPKDTILRLDRRIKPTEEIGNVGERERRPLTAGERRFPDPTESDVLGPYYRKGAPFRGKISPVRAKGRPLLISGRVWGFDSKRPLAKTILELWQADADGHYDNEDPAHPPPPGSYVDRARLCTDEKGYYEFESIHPGPYKMDATTWRAPHIHFRVHARGYRMLTTQLFFAGDPYTLTDPFIKASLIIPLQAVGRGPGAYERGQFDVVLVRRKRRSPRR